jgi:hypothetical protein
MTPPTILLVLLVPVLEEEMEDGCPTPLDPEVVEPGAITISGVWVDLAIDGEVAD